VLFLVWIHCLHVMYTDYVLIPTLYKHILTFQAYGSSECNFDGCFLEYSHWEMHGIKGIAC
jgi:hypothetical protein